MAAMEPLQHQFCRLSESFLKRCFGMSQGKTAAFADLLEEEGFYKLLPANKADHLTVCKCELQRPCGLIMAARCDDVAESCV